MADGTGPVPEALASWYADNEERLAGMITRDDERRVTTFPAGLPTTDEVQVVDEDRPGEGSFDGLDPLARKLVSSGLAPMADSSVRLRIEARPGLVALIALPPDESDLPAYEVTLSTEAARELHQVLPDVIGVAERMT